MDVLLYLTRAGSMERAGCVLALCVELNGDDFEGELMRGEGEGGGGVPPWLWPAILNSLGSGFWRR